MSHLSQRPPAARRAAFTLIELMVVITIIAILAGLAIPAIAIVVRNSRETAMKLEVDGLDQGVERYHGKYGDYPPDFSSWSVVEGHLAQCFPQISGSDRTLLYNMCHNSQGAFEPTWIDRAEALVFFLGGFSSSRTQPFTGAGGPFEFIDTLGDGDTTNPANYQYNTSRDNEMFSFDLARLSIRNVDPSLAIGAQRPDGSVNRVESDDERTLPVADPMPPNDLFPVFFPRGKETPYVYFDSRTYGILPESPSGNPRFNGYASQQGGGIRPYKNNIPKPPLPAGSSYGSPARALNAFEWMNPETFQIIAAGTDDIFAFMPSVGADDDPRYFIYPTGQQMRVNPDATTPAQSLHDTVVGYQETSLNPSFTENPQLDNITNFSVRTLESDIER